MPMHMRFEVGNVRDKAGCLDNRVHALARRITRTGGYSYSEARRGVLATLAIYGDSPLAERVVSEFLACTHYVPPEQPDA